MSLVLSAVVLTGWYVGYVIAAVLITVVVILVAIILGLARRIGVQADAATGALDQARINTLPLWDVDKVNGGVRSIIKSAQEARNALGGGQ
jgi:heme exporter protein D